MAFLLFLEKRKETRWIYILILIKLIPYEISIVCSFRDNVVQLDKTSNQLLQVSWIFFGAQYHHPSLLYEIKRELVLYVTY